MNYIPKRAKTGVCVCALVDNHQTRKVFECKNSTPDIGEIGPQNPFFGITSEWVRGIYFGLNTPTHVLMPFMEKESGIKHYVVNA